MGAAAVPHLHLGALPPFGVVATTLPPPDGCPTSIWGCSHHPGSSCLVASDREGQRGLEVGVITRWDAKCAPFATLPHVPLPPCPHASLPLTAHAATLHAATNCKLPTLPQAATHCTLPRTAHCPRCHPLLTAHCCHCLCYHCQCYHCLCYHCYHCYYSLCYHCYHCLYYHCLCYHPLPHATTHNFPTLLQLPHTATGSSRRTSPRAAEAEVNFFAADRETISRRQGALRSSLAFCSRTEGETASIECGVLSVEC